MADNTTTAERKGLIESVFEFVTELLGLTLDATARSARSYYRFVLRWTIMCGAAALLLAAAAAIGYVVGQPMVMSIGVTLIGFVLVGWLIPVVPVLMLLSAAKDRVRPLNRALSGLIFLALVSVSLGIYIYVFSSALQPRLLFLLMMLTAASVLLQFYRGIDEDIVTILAFRTKVGLAVLTIGIVPALTLWSYIAPYMPKRLNNGGAIVRWATGSLPQRIEVPDTAAFNRIEFFDTVTGEPRIWYAIAADDTIELFDNEGFHPRTSEKLVPVTKEIVRRLDDQIRERMQAAAIKGTPGRGAGANGRELPAQSGGRGAGGVSPARDQRTTYLNRSNPTRPIVLIVDNQFRLEPDLSDTVASAIDGDASVLTPAFVSDGLFRRAFDGDASVLRSLGLQATPTIVLGVKQTSVESDTSIDRDYKRGDTRIQIRVYRPADDFSGRVFSVTGRGPGFSAADASREADRAAVQQVVARLTGRE
jgi:hypothetical protein